MERFVRARWSVTPKVHVADKGVYVFRFETEHDMMVVYGGGPWMVKGSYPLVLKCWKPGVTLDPATLKDFPVWI